jgi:hypothetical protein
MTCMDVYFGIDEDADEVEESGVVGLSQTVDTSVSDYQPTPEGTKTRKPAATKPTVASAHVTHKELHTSYSREEDEGSGDKGYKYHDGEGDAEEEEEESREHENNASYSRLVYGNEDDEDEVDSVEDSEHPMESSKPKILSFAGKL